MANSKTFAIASCLVVAAHVVSLYTRPAFAVEPLLENLPPGVFVDRVIEVPASQTKSIASRLAADVDRLTNAFVRVHGSAIQVNIITTPDSQNASAVFKSLSKLKSEPFIVRKDNTVVEYVGKEISNALATKTSYELGLIEKPDNVTYTVDAEFALVTNADYMSINVLFNALLAANSKQDANSKQQISVLTSKFSFGDRLVLRNPLLTNNATYTFKQQVAISKKSDSDCTIEYQCSMPANRFGIPFVTANLTLPVDDTGFIHQPTPPTPLLTAGTQRWPSADAEIMQLAKTITKNCESNSEKSEAILLWLSPGKNLKYSGQTGSRWGTKRALQQKFGHCWDFSDCYVTLARAADVPARQVAGWLYGSSGHVWAEYYIENKGWQQVDPTGGGILNCGIYHIPYFTSEDGEMPIVYLSLPTIQAESID